MDDIIFKPNRPEPNYNSRQNTNNRNNRRSASVSNNNNYNKHPNMERNESPYNYENNQPRQRTNIFGHDFESKPTFNQTRRRSASVNDKYNGTNNRYTNLNDNGANNRFTKINQKNNVTNDRFNGINKQKENIKVSPPNGQTRNPRNIHIRRSSSASNTKPRFAQMNNKSRQNSFESKESMDQQSFNQETFETKSRYQSSPRSNNPYHNNIPLKTLKPLRIEVPYTIEQLFNNEVRRIRIHRNINGHPENKVIKLELKPWYEDGKVIIFKGEGDRKVGYKPQDVEFIITHDPNDKYQREGDDIIYNVTIPLNKALAGYSLSRKLIDGEKIKLNIKDITKPGDEKRVKNGGMKTEDGKRGDAVFRFKIKFPSKLTNAQKDQVKEFLPDN